MTPLQTFFRRIFGRDYVRPGTPATVKPNSETGPQINPGPGVPAVSKPNPDDGPQINGGPGDGFTGNPRFSVHGLRPVEIQRHSRPFGTASDDVLL